MSTTTNLIIGAGPAGLAVAGRFREMGIPFEMIEATDKIAWSWTNHYDRLSLHTVKQLSHLPHLPFPESYPTYVPRLDLVKYYNDYAAHFKINPHFNEPVTSVKRQADNNWNVTTKSGKSFSAQNVIIATGANRVPNFPKWPQQDTYEGELLHSRNYKSGKPYKGKKVLIIGMGNTGAEIALDLSEQGAHPHISVRSPVNIVPRDINGRPTQLTAKVLAKFPFGIGDWLGTVIRKFIVGDLSKYGLETASIPPVKQLRETGKTPVIDLGTVAHIKAGKIKVVPDIKHFTKVGATFQNDLSEDFDAVIVATGYKPQLDDFLESTENLLDKYNFPKSPIGKGIHEGLYFVGFDNYKLGGLLGAIYTDSEVIAKAIQKQKVLS